MRSPVLVVRRARATREARRDRGVRAHGGHDPGASAGRDEVRVRVVGESRLHRLEVEEGQRPASRRGGEAGADQRLAHRGVRAPDAERGRLEAHVPGRQHWREPAGGAHAERPATRRERPRGKPARSHRAGSTAIGARCRRARATRADPSAGARGHHRRGHRSSRVRLCADQPGDHRARAPTRAGEVTPREPLDRRRAAFSKIFDECAFCLGRWSIERARSRRSTWRPARAP